MHPGKSPGLAELSLRRPVQKAEMFFLDRTFDR